MSAESKSELLDIYDEDHKFNDDDARLKGLQLEDKYREIMGIAYSEIVKTKRTAYKRVIVIDGVAFVSMVVAISYIADIASQGQFFVKLNDGTRVKLPKDVIGIRELLRIPKKGALICAVNSDRIKIPFQVLEIV